MWAPIAQDLKIPWRSAEAMHWQLEVTEMSHRAEVEPFKLQRAKAASLHHDSEAKPKALTAPRA